MLAFCGELVKPESFLQLNEILLVKRVALRTIHLPWSMNQTNIDQVFEVIVQVLNSKKCGAIEHESLQVILEDIFVSSM